MKTTATPIHHSMRSRQQMNLFHSPSLHFKSTLPRFNAFSAPECYATTVEAKRHRLPSTKATKSDRRLRLTHQLLNVISLSCFCVVIAVVVAIVRFLPSFAKATGWFTVPFHFDCIAYRRQLTSWKMKCTYIIDCLIQVFLCLTVGN